MNIRLAWRNIWRNKRRTALTMAAIFLAVFMANIMRSFQLGTYKKMISNTVNTYTGYLQIHKRGYWNDKAIENSFTMDRALKNVVTSSPVISGLVPRLESFALASGISQTKGVMVIGIDPAMEALCIGLDKRLQKGSYLNAKSSGILIAEKCASYLGLSVGDSIVLLGQGYHGVNVAAIFPIEGIIHFPSPQLDRQLVCMPLTLCQNFYEADSMVTSVIPLLKNSDNLAGTKNDLEKKLNTDIYEIMAWNELLPEVVQQIQTDNIGGQIMLGILYMIVGFGIFGTIIMMTTERLREFGVLNAIGMSKSRLSLVVLIETLFLSLLAVAAGAIAALPVVVYISKHPIRFTGEAAQAIIAFGIEPVMPTLVDSSIFLHQGLLIFGLTIISLIFPILIILNLNSIVAVRR